MLQAFLAKVVRGMRLPEGWQKSALRRIAVLPGRTSSAALMALAGALLAVPAAAQAPQRPSSQIPYLPFRPVNPLDAPPAPAGKPPDNLETLKQRSQDLEAVRSEQTRAMEAEVRLKREIDAIGDDRRKLNQQLIETAARMRGLEDQVAATEERLKPLDAREQELRKSLDDRREVMAEVLAALQRIGRHPPPALMVSTQDALQSLRSAIMLGAVLPEMRQAADRLIADLAELTQLRAQIATEHDVLARGLASQDEERQRLTLLTDQRQKQQADSERALGQERQHISDLARNADNLKDLIAKLEQDFGPQSRGARGDRKDAPARPDVAALKDPGRLEPAIAFAAAKGRLPMPVNGVRIKEFGTPDGIGGTEKGQTVAARPGAQITAPCDGWVVYSGPFRNYGQLLILNAGSGYHVLLAGMDRISVELGQFVVTGEPVAVMGGGGGQVPAALAGSSGQPVLYVEFRKDGTPVDPSPWWATSEGEKVRG